MEGVLGIFQGIVNSDFLDLYLDAFEEHQSFRSKVPSDVDNVVQTISSLLTKTATRPVGLQLLTAFLEQCSVEVLEQKGHLWMTMILKASNARDLELHANATFDLLEKLAVMSQQSPDLTKSFNGNHLPKIYEALVNVPVSGYLSALRCIETCLRLYSGSSGPAKGSVELFLGRFVDSPDNELSRCSARCNHLLLQVRGGGAQGINYKTAWQIYQLKCLGSLHALLNEMFSRCTEIYDDSVELEQLNLAVLVLSDEPVLRAAQLYLRFRNIIGYLETALCEPFPVEKACMPKKIINLIGRGIGVTCSLLQQNSISDNLAMGALLPKIHFHLMQLLHVLMLTLRSHLKSQHHCILGILSDTIKFTSTNHSTGVKKPFLNLRSKAYEMISLWCSIMRSGSRCEIIAEFLVEEVFRDVFPFQIEFTLKVLSGARKHMSKKSRRQLYKTQNDQSSLSQAHSNNSNRKENITDQSNQGLCIAALRCLQHVLISSSNFLKPSLIKIIQSKIMDICGMFYELPMKRQHLYHNWVCRFEIYNLLYTVLMTPHHLCPAPTQMAINILQTAHQRDGIARVRHYCGTMLFSLEKLIHPQKESLLFPVDVRDIRNTFIKFGQERLLKSSSSSNPFRNTELEDSEDETDQYDQEVCSVQSNAADVSVDRTHSEFENVSKDKIQFEAKYAVEPEYIIENNLASETASKLRVCKPVLQIPEDEEFVENESHESMVNELAALQRKKQNLEKVNETQSEDVVSRLLDDEDILMADIEAAFVDELN